MSVTILALDPASSCGWALRLPGDRWISGVWALHRRAHEGTGMVYVRFLASFRELVNRMETLAPDSEYVVAYERPGRFKSGPAAEVVNGLVANLNAECEQMKLASIGVPPTTVKKAAVGSGNASKEQMVEAARERWPGFEPATDDEADARWVAVAAAKEVE